MAERLLTDDSVHTAVGKRHFQYVPFNDAGGFLKPDTFCQLLRARNARWGQFDTSDVGSIFVCQITHRAAKSCAEIGYPRSIVDLRSSHQFVRGGEAAIMILIMGK